MQASTVVTRTAPLWYSKHYHGSVWQNVSGWIGESREQDGRPEAAGTDDGDVRRAQATLPELAEPGEAGVPNCARSFALAQGGDGLDEKALGKEYTLGVIKDTHDFWQKLTASGAKTV